MIKKKFTVLLLSVCIMACVFPTTVFAAAERFGYEYGYQVSRGEDLEYTSVRWKFLPQEMLTKTCRIAIGKTSLFDILATGGNSTSDGLLNDFEIITYNSNDIYTTPPSENMGQGFIFEPIEQKNGKYYCYIRVSSGATPGNYVKRNGNKVSFTDSTDKATKFVITYKKDDSTHIYYTIKDSSSSIYENFGIPDGKNELGFYHSGKNVQLYYRVGNFECDALVIMPVKYDGVDRYWQRFYNYKRVNYNEKQRDNKGSLYYTNNIYSDDEKNFNFSDAFESDKMDLDTRPVYKFSKVKNYSQNYGITKTIQYYPDIQFSGISFSGTEVTLKWTMEDCITGETMDKSISILIRDHEWDESTKYNIVSPTCTMEGSYELHCKNYKSDPYSNFDGIHSTAVKKVITPALGHDWGEVTYNWSSDYNSCTARHVCKRCYTVESETVNNVKKVCKNLPTYDQGGENDCIAEFKNTNFKTATAVEEIPPLQVIDISVNSNNHKIYYTEGDELDVSNLTILVNDSSGNSKTVEVTKDMISGFDSYGLNSKQTLTITFHEKTTTYNIFLSFIIKNQLIVINGQGSGMYIPGKVVPITADKAPGGQRFKRWSFSYDDTSLLFNSPIQDEYAITTFFNVPQNGSVGKVFFVTANFEDIPVSSENLVVLRKSLITSQTLNSDYDFNNDGIVDVIDLVRLKKKLSATK